MSDNKNIKKLLLTRLIFVLIFAIVAVSITAFFVFKNKPVETEEEDLPGGLVDPQKQAEVTGNEKTIDINGTYDENSINIKTYTMDVQGREVEYLQIDGLKDESVEIKINQEMKSEIEKNVQEFLAEPKIANEIYTYTMVTGNFANILSIYSHVSAAYTDDTWHAEEKYFNFDLTSGEKIELTDIFSSKVSIKNILTDTLFEAIASNNAEYDENTGNLYLAENGEDIEENVYEIVSDYLRGKEIGFYITPQMIVIRENNAYAKILYSDYLEYITIYDKFSSKTDIYDGQYSATKDIPVLVDLSYFGETYLIEEEGENYYIRLGVINYMEDLDKVEQAVKNYVDNLASDYKKEAKESGIFKVYDGTFYVYENYENFEFNNYKAYANIYKLDTTKSNFQNVLKVKMTDHYKQDFSDSPELMSREFLPYITSECTATDEEITLDNLGNILVENENSNILGIED